MNARTLAWANACAAGWWPLAALGAGAPGDPVARGPWALFVQSFDLFTLVLGVGSLAAVAVIVRCILDIRAGRIIGEATAGRIERLLAPGAARELRGLVADDASLPARAVGAALRAQDLGGDRAAMREAAELAASEECARWFRMIEPLNVIGHLGPLVGLAGTVWGMIIAFTTLGETGGTAQAADLAPGIAKALFHTLLGLCLAIPCLVVFGLYRSRIDRACTRAMVVAADLVERLPPPGASRG